MVQLVFDTVVKSLICKLLSLQCQLILRFVLCNGVGQTNQNKGHINKRPRESIHVYISDFQCIISNMSLLVLDCGIIFIISKSCCFFKSIY